MHQIVAYQASFDIAAELIDLITGCLIERKTYHLMKPIPAFCDQLPRIIFFDNSLKLDNSSPKLKVKVGN